MPRRFGRPRSGSRFGSRCVRPLPARRPGRAGGGRQDSRQDQGHARRLSGREGFAQGQPGQGRGRSRSHYLDLAGALRPYRHEGPVQEGVPDGQADHPGGGRPGDGREMGNGYGRCLIAQGRVGRCRRLSPPCYFEGGDRPLPACAAGERFHSGVDLFAGLGDRKFPTEVRFRPAARAKRLSVARKPGRKVAQRENDPCVR
jgi:hypothetical protein